MYTKLFTFILLAFNLFFVFGYDCSILQNDIDNGSSSNNDVGAPDPRAIVCIIGRFINIFVGVAGLVLVYMILWGAFKLSMSQGDPKGYAGAQNTWFFALVGFLIVVGFFALYVILANILGLPMPSTDGLLTAIENGIGTFMSAAGVCANGINCIPNN